MFDKVETRLGIKSIHREAAELDETYRLREPTEAMLREQPLRVGPRDAPAPCVRPRDTNFFSE